MIKTYNLKVVKSVSLVLLALCSVHGEGSQRSTHNDIESSATYLNPFQRELPSDECSPSSSVDKEDCAATGLALGGILRNNEVIEGSWSLAPSGCFFGPEIHFNTNLEGVNIGAWESVCHKVETQFRCDGYFCDKLISTMFIFMTHNSFAIPTEVASPNQSYHEGRQFRDGIRGFMWDIYDENTDIVMRHGDWYKSVSYNDCVNKLVQEIDKPENINEIVLIIYEMRIGDIKTNDKLLAPWGSRLIVNFNADTAFEHYIAKGQRVLLLNRNSQKEESRGMHSYDDLVTENWYQWYSALDAPDFNYRRGPRDSSQSAKLMNHFCGIYPGLGSGIASSIVNTKSRILYDARIFAKQAYAQDKPPNIVAVDFHDRGDIWPAQEVIRNGDIYAGTLDDGTVCGTENSCFDCLNPYNYWDSKVITVCGVEPCWSDGSYCGAGITCGNCCNEYEWWSGLAFTACGSEPCWESGSICGVWTTCNECCGDEDCPWYQFGICTCV